MESGAILESQISASSEYNTNYAAHQARLHIKADGGKAGSWSALRSDRNQWLQVDLKQTTRVTRIAIQGRNNFAQWVTQFELQYGDNEQSFKFYKRKGDSSDTVCVVVTRSLQHTALLTREDHPLKITGVLVGNFEKYP